MFAESEVLFGHVVNASQSLELRFRNYFVSSCWDSMAWQSFEWVCCDHISGFRTGRFLTLASQILTRGCQI